MVIIALAIIKLISIFLLLTFSVQSNTFVLVINPITALLISMYLKRRGAIWTEFTSYFLLDVLVPVFGFLAATIFFMIGPIYKILYQNHKIDVFELPMGEEAYKQHLNTKELLNVKIENEKTENTVDEHLEIEPYVDILNGDNLKLKINVIEKLTRLATPVSVSILKKALSDSSYEVRYLSNNALEAIEKKYLAKIESVGQTISKFPEDYRNYNIRATVYLDTYTLGILDKMTGLSFLEKALYDFLFSLQLQPHQSYLYVKITHIHLLMGNYKEVIEIANMALAGKVDDQDEGMLLFYRAEANFHLRKFDEVRSDCKKVIEKNIGYELVRGPSEFWS